MEKIYALIEDPEFLRSLYAFSYNRTDNTYDAEDLTSEIILQILKSGKRNSDIQNPEGFIWVIARRTYADYCEKRKRYNGNVTSCVYSDEVLNIADVSDDDSYQEDEEKLRGIFREISFLSKIYRDVCIMYYLDEKPVSDIAKALNIKETTVKQRLFSARSTIKKGVEEMDTKYPVLKPIRLTFLGTGNPVLNDPRSVASRSFSQNLVYQCKDTPRSARELSEILNVPMPFVEEEIEIQLRGSNGYYGLLREADKGKYISNFIIVDCEDYASVNRMLKRKTDVIAERFDNYLKENKDKLLDLPFLNKSVTLPLIAWALVSKVNWWFIDEVTNRVREKYLHMVKETKREFFTFGVAAKPGQAIDVGFYGCDGINGNDIVNYKEVHISNIYGERIDKHFNCGHNISMDDTLLMMLKSINGVKMSALSGKEQENASRAIEVGYVYKEGDMLYTKPLVMDKDDSVLCNVVSDFIVQTKDLVEGCSDELYSYIQKLVPQHMIGEYQIFLSMSANGLLDGLVEKCIEIGLLNIPDRLCAEGMIVTVKQ